MKILLATFWAVPHVGGVWKYMLQVKSKLESHGHTVDLLGYGTDNQFVHHIPTQQVVTKQQMQPVIDARLRRPEYRAICVEPLVHYYETRRALFEIAAEQMGSGEYDLIHTQDVLSTTCIHAIRRKGTALVASLHGCVANELKHHFPESRITYQYIDELEYNGATMADVTIVANEWLKKTLTDDYHVPGEHIRVMHYGYDTKTFLEQMGQKFLAQKPPGKKVIMYTGRLTEIKGLHYLLPALHQLKSKRQDWVCWIVGDGDKQEELQAQSRSLGLEQEVVFWGKREDIPQLLSAADLFVLPSLFENQPLSVIEAQIAGVPVIVSNAGGLPEIVENGVTGVVTPAKDIDSLYSHISYLLEHDEYRKRLAVSAQRWAWQHWDLDHSVNKLLDLYGEALRKARMN